MTPPNTVNAERLTSHIASELLDLMKHVPLEHHGTLVAAAAIVEQRHAARAEPQAVDAERLLPCPFCAGPGFVRGDKFAAWVQCDKCGTEGPTISDEDSERGAVEAWNRRDTRAEPQAVDAERLREIAAIAHDGGLCGLSEADALIAIRRLSMRSWNISGSGQDRTMRVLSALALQDKAEVSELRRSWDAALAVDRPPTGEDTKDKAERVEVMEYAEQIAKTGMLPRHNYATPPTEGKAERVEAWWERMGWAGPIAMQWRTPLGDWSRWHDYSPDRQGDLVREGVEIRYAYPPATPPTGEDTAAAREVEVQAYREMHHRLDCLLGEQLQVEHEGDYRAAIENTVQSVAAFAQRPAAPREGVRCAICGEDEPYTGTCGSSDPRALCKQPREGVRGSGEAVATVLSLSDRGNELDVDQAALDQLPAGTKLYTRSEDARDGEDAVGHVTARGGIRWTSRAIPRTGTPLYARSEDARDARSEHDA